MSEKLKIKNIALTTNELAVEHAIIEFSDNSAVMMRKDQVDTIFDEARASARRPSP